MVHQTYRKTLLIREITNRAVDSIADGFVLAVGSSFTHSSKHECIYVLSIELAIADLMANNSMIE